MNNGHGKRLTTLERARPERLGARLDTLARALDLDAEDVLESLDELLAMSDAEREAYLRGLWDKVQEPETPIPTPLPSNGHPPPVALVPPAPADDPTDDELRALEETVRELTKKLGGHP